MVRTIAALLAVGALQLPPATFAETAVTGFFIRLDSRFVHYQTIYKEPIDDRHFLLLVRAARQPITWFGWPGQLPWGHDELLGVFLMDRRDAGRVWELIVLTDHTPLGTLDPRGRYEQVVRVERANTTTVLLSRTEIDHWGRVNSIKLFFDLPAKQLIKRVDYPPINSTRILRADNQFCAALTTGTGDIRAGVTPARQVCLEGSQLIDRATIVLTPPSDPEPPRGLPALPQPTYDDFAKARPERVKNGYRRATTTIDERHVAWQRTGNRVWFGTAFYDGEGTTGVGDLGYFDTTSKTFTFLRIPEFAPWSTSALLIEGDLAWVGLVGQYELSTKSNGLVRVDLRTRRVRRYEIHDVIHQIVRWYGTLYFATTDGLYALRGDRLTRYRFEPSLNGDLILVPQVLR